MSNTMTTLMIGSFFCKSETMNFPEGSQVDRYYFDSISCELKYIYMSYVNYIKIEWDQAGTVPKIRLLSKE